MIENRVMRVREELSRRGTSLERLSHVEQFRLADGLGMDVTDLHREMSRIEHRGAQRSATVPSRAKARKVQPETPQPDVVRSLTARHDEDVELRRDYPETLKVIDEISEQLGLDTSKSPSLRRAYIDARISEWRQAGEHNHTEDGDRQWKLYRRYSGKLQRALHADIQASSERDIAVASLRRQAQATAAASRMGAR